MAHGGARKGAGRKPLNDSRGISKSVYIPSRFKDWNSSDVAAALRWAEEMGYKRGGEFEHENDAIASLTKRTTD